MTIADIEISHPDKLLYPDDEISKKAVAEYYNKVSDYLLSCIKNRPITMRRYPDGISESGFFNKHRPNYFPNFVDDFTVPTRENQSKMHMVGVSSPKALVYLANQDVIELHLTLSRMASLEKPDQMIFDFDPSDDDFEKVRKAAQTLKKLLDDMNITSFVKTSGSRGLHVHVPIQPEHDFGIVKNVAKNIAEKLHQQCPDITTLEQRKNKRENKVFIDFLRNDYAMTAIAPYSLRALPGAPVATPLDWSEVNDPSLTPKTYQLNNLFRRLGQVEDPWEHFNYFNRESDLKSLF